MVDGRDIKRRKGDAPEPVVGSPRERTGSILESTMSPSRLDSMGSIPEDGPQTDAETRNYHRKGSTSPRGWYTENGVDGEVPNGVGNDGELPTDDRDDSDEGSTIWPEMPDKDSLFPHYGNGINGLSGQHAGRKRGRSSLSEQGLAIVLQHMLEGGEVAYTATGTLLADGFEAPDIAAALARLGWETSPERRQDKDKGPLKLSPAKIQELTQSPQSIPYRTVPSDSGQLRRRVVSDNMYTPVPESTQLPDVNLPQDISLNSKPTKEPHADDFPELRGSTLRHPVPAGRRPHGSRALSTPDPPRRPLSDRLSQAWSSRSRQNRQSVSRPEAVTKNHLAPSPQINEPPLSSPLSPSIPVPPLSLPTYLQLELASGRPSPLYIHHSATADFPYESSQVKLERLTNFLVLPPALEQVLWFGILACLDAWLHSFTILPLRFFKSIYILLESWAINLGAESRFISAFIIKGVGRVWRRRAMSSANPPEQLRMDSDARSPVACEVKKRDTNSVERETSRADPRRRLRSDTTRSLHRRQKSMPSALMPDDKADILKGLLMMATCVVLMRFDASRMYHWIRGQAAIKLYVIYNVLEVSDRLFAAIGQDVLECLFSREALERKPDGRSKVFRPFWLFLLALAYTVIHSMALFYQVMTLNVAVNSYNNALITLLLSNQFVEIKSTVFKKFEKENLFQLTCADVVERFQLWLMLTIIASRNIVETGAFNLFGALGSSLGSNSTSTNSTPLSTPPRTSTSILPKAFTIFPSSLVSSFSSVHTFLPSLVQVLGPFLVVLGSEMLVDWLKHAYINKFNNTRPAIYGRFLDILAKDYYNNAFGDQNLTRRLGLPIIPLSCLFFRVSVQTYQMFLAALLPQHPSTPPSDSTSLSSIHSQYPPFSSETPPLTLRSLIPSSASHVNALVRTALANAMPSPAQSVYIFTIVLILTGFIVLLTMKLLLGMLLLTLARSRYKIIKERESEHTATNGSADPSCQTAEKPRGREHYSVVGSRRVGGWGMVEVNDDKRRLIYADDPEGLRRLKGREEKGKSSGSGKGDELNLDHVQRYEMAAKRIW